MQCEQLAQANRLKEMGERKWEDREIGRNGWRSVRKGGGRMQSTNSSSGPLGGYEVQHEEGKRHSASGLKK